MCESDDESVEGSDDDRESNCAISNNRNATQLYINHQPKWPLLCLKMSLTSMKVVFHQMQQHISRCYPSNCH